MLRLGRAHRKAEVLPLRYEVDAVSRVGHDGPPLVLLDNVGTLQRFAGVCLQVCDMKYLPQSLRKISTACIATTPTLTVCQRVMLAEASLGDVLRLMTRHRECIVLPR